MRQSRRDFNTVNDVSQPRSSRSQARNSASRPDQARSITRHSIEDGVLFLKQSNVNFNPPSKKESIFFDECNREIISLTNNVDETSPPIKTRVISQQTDKVSRVELILPVGKKILSIRFNESRSVLAYHVERNIVEFINIKDKIIVETASSSSDPSECAEHFKYVLDDRRFTQTSRAKNCKLIGFLWTGPNEIVIITDLSIEYYHVDSTRRRLSLVKVFQSITNWFVYKPRIRPLDLDKIGSKNISPTSGKRNSNRDFSLLIVSTGSQGNSMQPYLFKDSRISKLQKFEVESNRQHSDKLEVFERSTTIGYIYGYIRLLVLQHESLNIKSKGAQVVLYTIDIVSGLTTKTHTLDLDTNGRFAINILDNLVIAHDQPSKTSFIFDIAIKSTEKSDCPDHYVSLIDNRSIKPLDMSQGIGKCQAEMYSTNWVFFQPNFIVDARLGLLSTLQIDLKAMHHVLQDNLTLLVFLAHRSGSEKLILELCRMIVCDSYEQTISLKLNEEKSGVICQQVNSLADVSAAFEILSNIVESAADLPSTSRPETTESGLNKTLKPDYVASIAQEDVDREIFKHLSDKAEAHLLESPAAFHFVSSVLFEFIFALRNRDDKNVHFCINERLVNCLARGRRYFQIIQMIRSDILRDSKQLACLLISMRDRYKPAAQLGLDMLRRLPCGLPAADLEGLTQG